MTIINRVPELVAERYGGKDAINVAEVQREVGLTYATVHSWLNDNIRRFDSDALDAWCVFLKVNVGDILVRNDDEHE